MCIRYAVGVTLTHSYLTMQDFRSENLVVDPTGITLQKRRMKGAERVNKRKEEGQSNKECECDGSSWCDYHSLTDRLPRCRRGVAQGSGVSIALAHSSPSFVQALGPAGCI